MTSAAGFDIGDVTAVVLAGGRGSRLGGTDLGDKARVMIGSKTLIEVVVSAIPDPVSVIAVGPPVAIGQRVSWVQEQPPGGGPVAALAAAIGMVETSWVAILPGDAPRSGLAIAALAAAVGSADVAVVTESSSGRSNPLLALWRRPVLVESIERLAACGGSHHRAGFDLYRSISAVEVPDTGGWGEDIDDPSDLESFGFSALSHPDARLEP